MSREGCGDDGERMETGSRLGLVQASRAWSSASGANRERSGDERSAWVFFRLRWEPVCRLRLMLYYFSASVNNETYVPCKKSKTICSGVCIHVIVCELRLTLCKELGT